MNLAIANVMERAVGEHVLARVTTALAELGCRERAIARHVQLSDLELDSLALAELLQILEYDLDVKLFGQANSHLRSVGDVVDLVTTQLSRTSLTQGVLR